MVKGIFEEYGTFTVSVIIASLVLSFLISSAVLPNGAFHKLMVVGMESMGAETQVVIEEWEIGSLKATLKDNGCLYITGNGTLPTYDSVSDTPWAEHAEDIDYVTVEDGVSVSGEIPIR